MATDESRTKIGPSSWISVAFLGGLLAAATYGTTIIVGMAKDLQHGLGALTSKADETAATVDEIRKATESLSIGVTGLSYRLDATRSEYLPYSVFASWAWDLQRQNPTVIVPKVGHDRSIDADVPKDR